MALKMLSGTKTITTIQEGSAYKERWTCPSAGDPWPDGSSARQEFLDSSGAVIAEIEAESVDNHYITFRNEYADVAAVPNGAGFRCYLDDPNDTVGEHLVRYGSVFRRQVFFPHSPSEVSTYEPKRYTDTFQRPAGALGGKWKNLLGQPLIFDNTDFWTGEDGPNTVGPNNNFFTRYFTRYYVPFNGDSIDLSISVVDKGSGITVVPVCCNSDGTSYLYAGFRSGSPETIELGIGHGTDLGTWLAPSDVLEPMVTPVTLTVADDAMTNFKLRFDEATKEFAFYNDDYTTKILSWVDEDDVVPHGKGYRYFAIAGNANLFDSGVQIGYISAANVV